MTAKTYLNQLRSLEATIAARKAEAERLKAERTYLQGISYDSDRVQHSASHNAQFEHLADIIADTERHITELARKRHLIISQIDGLQRPEYVEILQLRYIERQRFEAIACTMGYTYSWTIQLHGIALQAFAKKYLSGENSE